MTAATTAVSTTRLINKTLLRCSLYEGPLAAGLRGLFS
jgi:hypothetical protein